MVVQYIGCGAYKCSEILALIFPIMVCLTNSKNDYKWFRFVLTIVKGILDVNNKHN